jgi:hypothetical protein
MGKLEVHQLAQEEVYLDIVRIAEQYRLRADGSSIAEGSVCSLRCNGQEILVVARGSASAERHIFLDERSRTKLGVDLANTYDFEMTTLGFLGKLRWALQASDVRYSFPALVSVVSLSLGLLSVLLGILSLILVVCH